MIRICACVLEQAGIVTIPPTLPGKVHLVPAVGLFAKCLNYCPRFHRWHFDCGDPSLTHIEKAKERGDDALILAQGAHLEDWLLRVCGNMAFSSVTGTGDDVERRLASLKF